MMLNKKSFLKSIVCGLVLTVLNLLLLHTFPSFSHPPLEWQELASLWFLWLSFLIVLTVVFYIVFEDYNEQKRKEIEKKVSREKG